ncbi:MAG: exonuclease domain-containing protein [Microbacterium sp.]
MSTEITPAHWANRVGVFDLETTGVDVETDRVVTAHVGLLDARGAVIESKDWLADPGIAIPEGASAVHGVTTEHARTHGTHASVVVAEVTGALRALLSEGIPVVAYNAAYDFSLLMHEARRHNVTPLLDPAPIIDPLVIDKAFDRYRRGKRTLEAVAEHYAVPLESAHEASLDAIAAGRLAQALARQFPLPENLAVLHKQQIDWARTQAAGLTEYFIRIGKLQPHEVLDGSWPVRVPR